LFGLKLTQAKPHPLRGRKQTAEHISKRMESMKRTVAARTPEKQEEVKRTLSNAHKGYKMPEEHRRKISVALKGKQNCLGHKPSAEHRRKLSEYWLANREKLNTYVDGKGHERNRAHELERGRVEYRLWRESVFKRDGWTCVHCGQIGGRLHADHIKPWAHHPELRYDVDNGRTLCVPCHHKTPTYGVKSHRKRAPAQLPQESVQHG
jgi:hypothetical protein